MLLVNVENDGEQDATDFRLDVEFPTVFLDGSGYVIQIPPDSFLKLFNSDLRSLFHF